MLAFTHNSQHYEFHGHACIKRYTCILLNDVTGVCNGLERIFFTALIRRHPSAHLLTHGLKEIRVRDNQLYVVNQEGASIQVSLTHCYAGENVTALLNAMRMAVADDGEEAGSWDASATAVDPLCCAFIEKHDSDEGAIDLPRHFDVGGDGLTATFKFGEDLRFISAWRAYYDQETRKKTTKSVVAECPGEWLNSRSWCSGRRNKNPSYSRTVNQKTLIVCKHQQQWVFIYNGARMDALARETPKEAMKAAHQYCCAHNLLS